ncbi:MAG TPA: hypothetical protein VFQ88_15980 [Nevskiaceae bacterium]|nr:hypothetical protein [Nevskiaceae bacterium]
MSRWEIQSSAKAQQGGAQISITGFDTLGWHSASAHATVMAGLLESGVYRNLFHGDNLRSVRAAQLTVPWWYRGEFGLAQVRSGQHTLLRTNGMIASADVWVNGHEVADHTLVAGAYPVHEFDVTPWVHAGTNTVALLVYPADPYVALTTSWVDWNPTPPDNNMGPWRGVDVIETGPVQLRYPVVTSSLSLPGLAEAKLTVEVEARNLDDAPRTAVIRGNVAGVALQQKVQLAPHATKTIIFMPKTDPGLRIEHPKVWWPIGMGAHPLYPLALTASVGGQVSDRAEATFGIRSVTSHLTIQGYRQFVVNGVPVLIRGGGWAPDMFLRDDPARMATEFSYVENLGLNTIRLEGKLEDQRFYDLADRDGIMVLPGWECCSEWEAAAKTGGKPWDAQDYKVAAASMASEARLLRNHPSVIGFLIGSDNAPPPRLSKLYVDTLKEADWQTPIVSAASDQASVAAGPSGMKMSGPYGWVPPNYWYGDQVGGAFGFNAETSAGPDIPRLIDIQRMLTPLDQLALWKYPAVKQYHAAAFWSPFSSLELFDTALAKRYGAPRDLADYVQKAQLANYDNVRAEFEAYSAHMDAPNPSTGVIYWMLNNAWPSLHWHLYDYYMNPAGAYFGAKKANELVHIQYAYDDHAVVLVNHTLTAETGLQALVRVRDLDGKVRYQKDVKGIALAANHAQPLMALPQLTKLSSTYFVELELENQAGKPISRNVYWLSTQPDELDWKKSNWYTTPVSRYANLTALQTLPQATVKAHAQTQREGDEAVTSVTLTVPQDAKAVALFQHVSIRDAAGNAVVPILWSDNDVTLWPGESVTLTARYRVPAGAAPTVRLSGWNVAAMEVAVGATAVQPGKG